MIYDLLGAITSLLATYYFIRQNINAWKVTILATLLNGWLYWQTGIYADMALEIFYGVSAGYGWYQWSYKASSQPAHTIHSKLSKFQWTLFLLSGITGYYCLLYALTTWTNSTIARLDALTTTLSLMAQWLMCHKILFTWVLWFFTDALYVFMYWHKSLLFHELLMIIYTLLAIVGFVTWIKQRSLTPSQLPAKLNQSVEAH